ncbi:hypothetical protein MFLAVUS_003910 [Mucor flavus]|uniref:Eukaryotic translation initiation factor 3 subunit J n=1 Tax=Mucor flavus TaxID=439312 RepID=A0ABP9YUE4_9FUNG
MSDWEEEDIDVKVEVVIPKQNKWDDEDVEEDVKESWEDSDDEEKSDTKKPAPVLKKKVPVKQKIAEKLAAEEQKKKELEAKKLAGEDEEEEETEEDAYERKERMRRLELEADMMNATDLFAGVSVDDMKNKPLEECTPKNRIEMDTYRKRLVELMTFGSKSINYGWFIDELLRDIAVPLKDTEVKKIASALTVIANEKQRIAKDALKKGKGKGRPQLAAAGKNSAADDSYADNGYDYDDFM